jgi:hypothetical protein
MGYEYDAWVVNGRALSQFAWQRPAKPFALGVPRHRRVLDRPRSTGENCPEFDSAEWRKCGRAHQEAYVYSFVSQALQE